MKQENYQESVQAQLFLRSGKGTERRQQASQSSKRYIPKGGFLIDFTTQPLPKGKDKSSTGCPLPIAKDVLIARQQRAAARLSAPKNGVISSPRTRRDQLPSLDAPDHPKPWGANRPKTAQADGLQTMENGYAGRQEKGLACSRGVNGEPSRTIKVHRAPAKHADQAIQEALDDEDIFDDDAPLLPHASLRKAEASATDTGAVIGQLDICKAPAEVADRAEVSSKYVQQLLHREAPAAESALHMELLNLKAQITDAAAALQLEKQAFQRSRAEDQAGWQEMKRREEQRLQREKAILSRQSQVLLKLPTKREKAEVEALSAALEEERRLGHAKDARHKLTVERLRRHNLQLQEKVAELEDEVRWHARHSMDVWPQKGTAPRMKPFSNQAGHAPAPEQAALSTAASINSRAQGMEEQTVKAAAESCGQDRPSCSTGDSQPGKPSPSRHVGLDHSEATPHESGRHSTHSAAAPPGTLTKPEQAAGLAASANGACAAKVGATLDAPAGGSCSLRGKPAAEEAREVSEHRQPRASQRNPPLVSWQVDVDRSRKATPPQGPAGSKQSSTTQSQAPSKVIVSRVNGLEEASSITLKHSHANLADMQADSHESAQSVPAQAQRPKPCPLPPLPSFAILCQPSLPNPGRDTPRMEALYAAMDLSSLFSGNAERTVVDRLNTSGYSAVHPHAEHTVLRESASGDSPEPTGELRSMPGAERFPASLALVSGLRYQDGPSLAIPQEQNRDSGAFLAAPGLSARGSLQVNAPEEETGTSAQHRSDVAAGSANGSMSCIFEAIKPSMAADADACLASTTIIDSLPQEGDCNAAEPSSHAAQSSVHVISSAEGRPMCLSATDGLLQSHYGLEPDPSAAAASAAGVTAHDSSTGSPAVPKQQGAAEAGKASADAGALPAAPARDGMPLQDIRSLTDFAPQEGVHAPPASDTAVSGIVQEEATGVEANGRSAHSVTGGLAQSQAIQGSSQPSASNTTLKDSSHRVNLPNGTVKQHCDDGRTLVRFSNGDFKRSLPDGIVEYFYAKADTWHTTCPEGVEVYHFPTGQTEAHHKGGLKEIIFPDNKMRLVHSQGAESDADLDMLTAAVKRAKPMMESL